MPIYEYKREDGTIFEIIQKMSDEPLEVCPTTGQKVEKLLSHFSAHFRGSGFYKTDYKDKERKTKKVEVEGKTVEVKKDKKDKNEDK